MIERNDEQAARIVAAYRAETYLAGEHMVQVYPDRAIDHLPGDPRAYDRVLDSAGGEWYGALSRVRLAHDSQWHPIDESGYVSPEVLSGDPCEALDALNRAIWARRKGDLG